MAELEEELNDAAPQETNQEEDTDLFLKRKNIQNKILRDLMERMQLSTGANEEKAADQDNNVSTII